MIDNIIGERVEHGDYALTIYGFERCVERDICTAYDPTLNRNSERIPRPDLSGLRG
jgi:hypothetical protein